MTAKTISLASRTNAPAMIDTLAAAFIDDPALSWILPDASDRHQRLQRFFRPMVIGALGHGAVLRSDQDEAVTLWRVPGKIHAAGLESFLAFPQLVRALGSGTSRALRLSATLHAHEPHDFPYQYLQFAGVAPAYQGKGWGGAAIRAGLERARTSGLPTYLETATPGNVGLYQRLGFAISAEWDVPGDGPHFWGMICR
jgi:ribosomal protein S18 acetylase RimI-like enzyme